MTRTRLPHRRRSETRELRHAGHAFSVTVGFDPAAQPLEVFADGRTSQLGQAIADACVAISLALQQGCPPEVLAQAMGRMPDPARGPSASAPASPLGAIAEALAEAAAAGVSA